jgi:short-subunit dehydrogenase
MTRTVLISGGTKGIGKSAVLQLLKDGFNVATFSRNQEKVDQLQSELVEQFPSSQFLVLVADVAKESSVEVLVSAVVTKFESVDILMNNAGMGYFRDADQLDLSRFQEMIQTNIVGVALLTKYVVPIMKKNKSGLIINVASISGKVAFANGEFYSATKFGVMGYSQAIRAELSPVGIKVSTICPGMIKTDFFDEEELERRKKIWNGKVPQMLEVSDIARVVSLICNQSEHSDIQDITIMPF